MPRALLQSILFSFFHLSYILGYFIGHNSAPLQHIPSPRQLPWLNRDQPHPAPTMDLAGSSSLLGYLDASFFRLLNDHFFYRSGMNFLSKTSRIIQPNSFKFQQPHANPYRCDFMSNFASILPPI